MDVNTTTTTTTTHAPSLSKSPERESQTPPRIKAISSSNGVLKRHFIHHAPSIPVVAVYKECLKNHAASIGGHALDGCGEFLPAPTATPADPTSLKCAACGCHRNFHRREPEDFTSVSPVIEYHPHHRHHPLPPAPPNQTHALHPPPHAARESASPPPISSSYMLLALSGAGGGGGGGAAAAAHNVMNSSGSGHPNSSSRKRFRTKFSQDQKDKMYELAEKVGWKLQKTNEEMVNGICSDIGVERGVFKVWMHNNKNTFAKRSTAIAAVSGGSSDHRNGDFKSEENNNNGGLTHHHHHHHHTYNGKSNESNDPANASSSSS